VKVLMSIRHDEDLTDFLLTEPQLVFSSWKAALEEYGWTLDVYSNPRSWHEFVSQFDAKDDIILGTMHGSYQTYCYLGIRRLANKHPDDPPMV
jgi:hypothetical protein